jgi:tRNA threonylcarbamoyl adenosine modification protein YeaZ
MILALETATNVCSVAFCNGDGSVHEKRVERRGTHSEQLFLFIEELQEEHGFSISDLDAVLVSEGPGSYTGLRISASAVKGLLFQTDVPLYGINTLASFAMQALREHPAAEKIHSIINARRVHVYHQQFTASPLKSDDEVSITPIEQFEEQVQRYDVIIGTGLERLEEEVLEKAITYGPEAITAKSLIYLYKGRLYKNSLEMFCEKVDPESFEPKYYTSNQVN